MRWLIHILGIDTQNSPYYDFWSGIATQTGLLLAGAGWFAKHNCHARGCLRIGKHQVEGTPWCTKHKE